MAQSEVIVVEIANGHLECSATDTQPPQHL
jgi:hypothetical protein